MKINTKEIAYTAILAALTVLAISLVRVPAFNGKIYFHLGETIMLTSALLLGRRGGALVGGIGAAIADLVLGFAVWAPISFLIHGLKGYIVGGASEGKGTVKDLFALIYGVAFMIAGYALAAGLLYGKAAVPMELFGDSMQGSVGVICAWVLAGILRRSVPGINVLRDRLIH